MNAFAGFAGSTFKLGIHNVVHLVGTSADAQRMGGTFNNVFSDFQSAYDIATGLTSGGVSVTIFVHETTAAQVGNLTLPSGYNTNVKIVGESPIVSVVGNINQDFSGIGANVALTIPLISNVTIGNISARQTGTGAGGTGGAAGAITLTLNNAIIGSVLTTSVTSNGGAVVINTNSATSLNRNSFVGAITTTGGTTNNAGNITITGGFGLKIGNITTASGANSGGQISISECDKIGAISSTSSTNISNVILTNCREITSINTSGTNALLNMNSCNVTGNVAANCTLNPANHIVTKCNIGGSLTLTSTSAPVFNIENTVVTGAVVLDGAGTVNSNITQCFFKSTTTITSSVMGISASNSTFVGNVINLPGISVFRTCTFIGIFTGMAPTSGQPTGAKFYNCSFDSAGILFTGISNHNIPCVSCAFAGKIVASSIAIPTEREYTGNITTSNATPGTLFTMPVPTGQRMRIVANVSATTGTSASFQIIANIVKNNAGTLTLVGPSDSVIGTPIGEAAFTGSSIVFAVSGANVILQVTGIAATTIVWAGSFKVISSF